MKRRSIGVREGSTLGRIAIELPDPTPAEARALILGTGGFWAGWALAIPFFTDGVPVSLIAFFIAFACGVWLYFGGVFHVFARAQGTTAVAWYFRGLRQAPWKTWRTGGGMGWMKLMMPAYFRRSARVLGWNEGIVLSCLGLLLLVDMVAAVFLFRDAPRSG